MPEIGPAACARTAEIPLHTNWKATDRGVSHNSQYGWYVFSFERQAGGEWLMARVKHAFQWVDGNDALLDIHDPDLGQTMQKLFCEENFAATRATPVVG